MSPQAPKRRTPAADTTTSDDDALEAARRLIAEAEAKAAEPEAAAGDGPVQIDLDAARAARREKAGPAPFITFLGTNRPLPQSMPAEVLDLMGNLAEDYTVASKAFRVLLGEEVYDTLMADAKAAGDPLDLEDVTFLLAEALKVYGVTAPE